MLQFIKITIYSIFICNGIIKADSYNNSCITDIRNREIYRNDFTFPDSIQSENFVIHFTVSNVDSQFVNGQWFNLQSNYGYAQSILDHLEIALTKYLQAGWEDIPPDCDETVSDINSVDHCINFGGNSLYDVYISNDAAGMVVPENPYSVLPYTGGYTSYMKISTLLNQYEALPSWNYHVVAHELHHSIQLRYGYSVSGSPGQYMYNGWLFEQTATYMENVIYPESFHLRTMLANCNVVTPLTYPNYNIDYPAEIYPYRSALWQKFLVESLEDSSIVRYIWEDYGLEYAIGNPVSLFPIYNNAVEYVTNGQNNLSDAYTNYSIWRYFTGDRSIVNEHFNESISYCTSTTRDDLQHLFSIDTEKGGAYFIDLPSENLNIFVMTDFPNDVLFTHLEIDQNNNANLVEIYPQDDLFSFNIFSDFTNVLIANSNYNNLESNDIIFSILTEELNLLGDVNFDGNLNVLDVVILVNLIFENEYNITVDLNDDQTLDVIDVVLLVNLILS